MIIKTFLNILLFGSTIAFAGELQTVPFVDPSRYVGVWYQVAGIPQVFDQDCVCARQELSIRDDGQVGVYNTCNSNVVNGPLREIRGVATNLDKSTNAKFKVDFGLPMLGDYWIIGLDTDYRYAVVSEPNRQALFILSRTPKLARELYSKAVRETARQMDTSRLRKMVQKNCSYPSLSSDI